MVCCILRYTYLVQSILQLSLLCFMSLFKALHDCDMLTRCGPGTLLVLKTNRNRKVLETANNKKHRGGHCAKTGCPGLLEVRFDKRGQNTGHNFGYYYTCYIALA